MKRPAPFRTRRTQSKTIKVNVYPRNNTMPNCVHGSSTSNLHFHGTHTTPSTTGDNVLLYIRPALRVKAEGTNPDPTHGCCRQEQFWQVFRVVREKRLADTMGTTSGRDLARRDTETSPQGVRCNRAVQRENRGVCRPQLQLWPKNERDIARGEWPQYSVGAFPYCFRLPDYATARKHRQGQDGSGPRHPLVPRPRTRLDGSECRQWSGRRLHHRRPV